MLDPGWGKFLSLDPAHTWELLARFDELVARLGADPGADRHLAQGLLRRAHGGARPALAAHQPRAPPRKGRRVIRTHEVRMAAQFLDAAARMRLPLPAALAYR